MLDFNKAFDKVSHNHLAIKYYEIEEMTLDWIIYFLSHRMQRVLFEGFILEMLQSCSRHIMLDFVMTFAEHYHNIH